MYNSHQRFRHSGRVRMLYHIPAVYNTLYTLLHQSVSSVKNLLIAGLASASYQYWYTARYFYNPVVVVYIVCWICFYDIGAQLYPLSYQGNNFLRVTVHHIASSFTVLPEYQWFNHQRHGILLAERLYF